MMQFKLSMNCLSSKKPLPLSHAIVSFDTRSANSVNKNASEIVRGWVPIQRLDRFVTQITLTCSAAHDWTLTLDAVVRAEATERAVRGA
jgi:spore coat protein U-like protein